MVEPFESMDHHYVPRFYTAHWADSDGKVLRYRRVPTGRVASKRVAPKSTAFEPDLYAAPPAVFWEEHDAHVIEREFFSPIDNAAAVVIEKLLNGASGLTTDERAAWALFMNSLLHRHRDDIFERDAAAPALAAEVRANMLAGRSEDSRARIEEALADVDVDQLARTAHRSVMVQTIRDGGTLEAIKQLAWEVVAVNPDFPLITTDRPVLVNLGEQRPQLEIITMALSPTRLLVAYPAHWKRADGSCIEGVDGFVENVTFAHDLFLLHEQQCRFVYTTAPLGDVVSDGRLVRMGIAVENALQRWPE